MRHIFKLRFFLVVLASDCIIIVLWVSSLSNHNIAVHFLTCLRIDFEQCLLMFANCNQRNNESRLSSLVPGAICDIFSIEAKYILLKRIN